MWWFNFVFGCKFFKPVLFFSVSEYDNDVRQRKIKLVLKSLTPPTPPPQ